VSPISKIVVGTDFSQASERALSVALDLAERLDAEVELVHVYALPTFNLPLEGAMMPSASHAASLLERLQELLDGAVARHSHRGLPLRAHLRNGSPHEDLCHFAREVGAGLIVVGTHGRTGVAHALLGSVAERVLRLASCPVLSVPPPV
jgi:nucleotide-binding universal stress UspA family protein